MPTTSSEVVIASHRRWLHLAALAAPRLGRDSLNFSLRPVFPFCLIHQIRFGALVDMPAGCDDECALQSALYVIYSKEN